jgi:hypothetical protein
LQRQLRGRSLYVAMIIGIPTGRLLDTPARVLVVVVVALVASLAAWALDAAVHEALRLVAGTP